MTKVELLLILKLLFLLQQQQALTQSTLEATEQSHSVEQETTGYQVNKQAHTTLEDATDDVINEQDSEYATTAVHGKRDAVTHNGNDTSEDRVFFSYTSDVGNESQRAQSTVLWDSHYRSSAGSVKSGAISHDIQNEKAYTDSVDGMDAGNLGDKEKVIGLEKSGVGAPSENYTASNLSKFFFTTSNSMLPSHNDLVLNLALRNKSNSGSEINNEKAVVTDRGTTYDHETTASPAMLSKSDSLKNTLPAVGDHGNESTSYDRIISDNSTEIFIRQFNDSEVTTVSSAEKIPRGELMVNAIKEQVNGNLNSGKTAEATEAPEDMSTSSNFKVRNIVERIINTDHNAEDVTLQDTIFHSEAIKHTWSSELPDESLGTNIMYSDMYEPGEVYNVLTPKVPESSTDGIHLVTADGKQYGSKSGEVHGEYEEEERDSTDAVDHYRPTGKTRGHEDWKTSTLESASTLAKASEFSPPMRTDTTESDRKKVKSHSTDIITESPLLDKDASIVNEHKSSGESSSPTSFVFESTKKKSPDTLQNYSNDSEEITSSSSDKSTVQDSTANDSFATASTNSPHAEDAELLDSADAEMDSTRVPKKIEENQYDGRSRPSRPDPGYHGYALQAAYARPYRPDVNPNQRPYFRPTPDYRTPLIRENQDHSKQGRPDYEFTKPNYFMAPHSQVERGKQPLENDFSKPYRPSFAKPHLPSSSFSNPFRPDYHWSSHSEGSVYSQTSSDYGTSETITEQSGTSKSDFPDAHDQLYRTETVSGNRKYSLGSVRPAEIVRDVNEPKSHDYEGFKAYRPVKDSILSGEQSKTSRPGEPPSHHTSVEESWSKSTMFTEEDTGPEKSEDSANTAKFDGGDIYRKPGIHPRPSFGTNYAEKLHTTSLPFGASGSVVGTRNLTRVEVIKADCFDNHMKVSIQFNGSFEGLVYSSGYSHDPSCNYINGSGRSHYEFFIRLNRCGTLGQQEVSQQQRALSFSRKRQERAQYLVNTVTVQYNPIIEEDVDEHFRVTCEYGYNFWKTVTFPVISVESSEVKLRTGNPVVFTLPPPQCNMEIRSGYGPTGNRVNGPVNVGDPLTLVIHMKSETPGFDILVSNCVAHNGGQKRLKLVDSNGCVVQGKLISAFRGVSSPDRSQQLTLYAYLKAFRFTGSPALYIECDVHMCHGSCPPQRCYWRHLYKRAVGNITSSEEHSDSATNVLSESISLFQALEVRHDDVDPASAYTRKYRNLGEENELVCMRTAGFASMFSSLLLLLLLSSFVSICLCTRLRRMNRLSETQDSNYFVSFDGHTSLK